MIVVGTVTNVSTSNKEAEFGLSKVETDEDFEEVKHATEKKAWQKLEGSLSRKEFS